LFPITILIFVFSFSSVQAQNPAASFDPICTEGQSMESCAIRKLNHGLLPEEQAQETTDAEVTSWLGQIGQALDKFVQSFFVGADNLKEGYRPAPSASVSAEQSLKDTLAGPEGFYGATLPNPSEIPFPIEKPAGTGLKVGPITLPNFNEINADERFFEQSYVPEKICFADGSCETVCPITGQCTQ